MKPSTALVAGALLLLSLTLPGGSARAQNPPGRPEAAATPSATATPTDSNDPLQAPRQWLITKLSTLRGSMELCCGGSLVPLLLLAASSSSAHRASDVEDVTPPRARASGASVTAPVSFSSFENGGTYRVPDLSFSYRDRSRIATSDDFVLKAPNAHGYGYFLAYVVNKKMTGNDVRGVEERESVGADLQRYPVLQQVARDHGDEMAHYLYVHWLQYDRLRESGVILLPETRFVVLIQSEDSFPACVQRRVRGESLWELWDHENVGWREASYRRSATIKGVLRNLVNSEYADHVDWNVQNFVYDSDADSLYYVDWEPTIYVAKSGNDHNLSMIRRFFL